MTAQKIPMLDLKRTYARIRQEITDAVTEVLESQAFILGPEVSAFEDDCSA